MLKIIALVVAGFLALWILAGFVIEQAFAPRQPTRGEFVDIGGRKMRLVCDGPPEGQPVWLEAGAFGFSADFADLQAALANEGFFVCAYDRAGLGYSDPGALPRDSAAIVTDLERLMQAKGVTAPVILLGHSMGGQHVRLFAVRHPQRVSGLVLVDAATPEAVQIPLVERFVRAFGSISNATAVAASLGLTKPLFFLGDRIGLSGPAVREKQAMFVSGAHARTAANEAGHWLAGAALARAAAGAVGCRWRWRAGGRSGLVAEMRLLLCRCADGGAGCRCLVLAGAFGFSVPSSSGLLSWRSRLGPLPITSTRWRAKSLRQRAGTRPLAWSAMRAAPLAERNGTRSAQCAKASGLLLGCQSGRR